MSYSVRAALQNLFREKWINLLSILTIAAGLLVATVVLLVLYNVNRFTKGLPDRFSITAYLKDGMPDQDVQQLIAVLRGRKAVERVKYISKAEAWRELKTSLKDADYIIEGLQENPLPASIEIRLRREAVTPESVKSLASDIGKMAGVEDVDYGERLLLSIHSLRVGVESIGLLLSTLLIIGITFICYSTVKILFYRRTEEIETLKLLGATRGFIRTPFLVEGGVIGLLGGAVSSLIVAGLAFTVLRNLARLIPLLGSVSLPPLLVASLPVAGLFLGITGAFIAIGKIRF